MSSRFFRSFFWAVLVASLVTWLYVGYVTASSHEAVLIDDRLRGVDPSIVRPGESRFIPARAYPNRITLHRVDIGPRVKEYTFRAGLAQSEVLELDDSFYIKVPGRYEYELEPDKLPALFNRLSERNWEKLDGYLDVRLNEFFRRKLAALYRNDNDIGEIAPRLSVYMAGDALKELTAEFSKDGVRFRNIIIGTSTKTEGIYVPDPARYRNMVEQSRDILATKLDRIKKLEEARSSQEAEIIKDQAYFKRLDHIGKLLAVHPQLRDYLAIDRLGKNVDVLVMPYDRWFSPDQERLSKAIDRSRNGTNGNGNGGNGNANGGNGNGGELRREGPRGVRDLTPP